MKANVTVFALLQELETGGIPCVTALRNTLRRQLHESKRDRLCTAAGAGDRRDSLATNDAHSFYHCLTWRSPELTHKHATY